MDKVRPMGDGDTADVLELVEAAADADGVGPLSEHTMLALRGARAGTVIRDRGVIVAYAHLDPADGDEPAAAELVVHPKHRRRGHGRALLRALSAETNGPLRIWAHGDLPAAAAFAHAEGLTRARALFQMRRPASDPLPEPHLAEGITLRTFEPGRDERAWLEVNARAFADHPEQGSWTIEDVRDREAEAWFDPAGFFLAERDGRLAGFHWTKIHPDNIGEVYVIGVAPDAQGLGLGRALTLTGLHHLRARGVDQLMLYVDESNTAAVHLYESLGFTHHAVDVMYAT
ncbi:mycothiol synthase [Actinomadura spongiicola]|uniref:Mycothiol acetyltransferase n=1 Tax=Actinomadura spongiicola TaxID=2303421 RepID=A0A372GEG8_9ACTN|nr:mycothiol synthase [Actinomadura spongiicola]RFS83788.1 mycothiol synthase [Actinomadura spongiicola]